MPPRLEEVTYDMSRAALADQESLVTGIRSRTGTLIAVQALVASFLGRAAIEEGPLGVAGWAALALLALGLALAGAILAPWRLTFALDAREVYLGLHEQAAAEAGVGTFRWLVQVARAHDRLHRTNRPVARLLAGCSAVLAVITIVQTLLWIAAIGVA